MIRRVRNVVILGSGVMGAQIAAHCVNAGLNVTLLDLKSDDPKNPNKQVHESLKKISGMKPKPFGTDDLAAQICTGNFEDDLDCVKAADWVCEVIVERMDIKKDMMARLDKLRSGDTIVSSNTSGLPISDISSDCSETFRNHFLGTHFFNPPRYMRLLELIPATDTDPEVVAFMHQFLERVLGKGVVHCKDTPNFIANRIGVFSMASIMPHVFNGKHTVEEIDALTGTLTGYAKSATFRTADMVGLDVLLHVAENLHPAVPDDEKKELFDLPEPFKKMVKDGRLGNKSGSGFYKKVRGRSGREFHSMDADSMGYSPQKDTSDGLINEARKIKDPAERLKFLSFHDSDTGRFIWEIQRELLLYAANRIPEISDSIASVDRAMRWGFNWELGPFERWDALGIHEVVERCRAEGHNIPAWVEKMLDEGFSSFYADSQVFDPVVFGMTELNPPTDGMVPLSTVRSEGGVVMENDSAALLDIGDGVALFEFRTKNATLGFELVETLGKAIDVVEKDFAALVVSHEGSDFAFGANLVEAGAALKRGKPEMVEKAVEQFQKVAARLRYSTIPVIAAPFGRTLGGGAEFVMHADRVVAHFELYMGLVEVGVGLIPAGGGTTELLRRAMENLPDDSDPLPFIREVFKTIGLAKVSDSALKAKEIGYLSKDDVIVMNRDLLIPTAKEQALAMVSAGYQPPRKRHIRVLGVKAESVMKTMLYIMHGSGHATDYDQVVAGRVAKVLAGGSLSEPQDVSPEHLWKLERDAIMECFQDERTHARIEHMLKTGKPLRN